ncbi:hypothetical protein BJF78_01125 [Pseudonocardia sp. CNS-139]|nr:hypothetical protein BJF78_01125 [Pseudonocardia sp. CNS-139]
MAAVDVERVALLEQVLRGAGFTDVFAEVGHGPDGVAAVDVTGQYRFCWVRGARLVEGPAVAWTAGLGPALAAAVAAVAPGASPAGVAEAAEPVPGLPPGAVGRVTVVHQADLSTGGDHADATEPLPSGAVVVVGVEVLFPDGGRVAVTETVAVEAS